MLVVAGLNYFGKDAAHVTPADFVELDYCRKLEFVRMITLDKMDSCDGEYANEKN